MEQSEWRLGALSPLDGRYGTQMKPYAAAFSEGALIRERFAVEVAWLKQLAALPELTELLPLTDGELAALDGWVAAFGSVEAESVKRIEAVTNHDVKAVEYYLKNRLVHELGWTAERAEFVHFAATSEDVNNLAYARMVRRSLGEVWLPAAEVLVDDVRAAALKYAQPRHAGPDARPTGDPDDAREGAGRLRRSLGAPTTVGASGGDPGQMGGATGTLAAHVVAYPELDWLVIARDFVTSNGFTWAPLTTQIEAHDWMAELFDAMSRFGTVLIDFCRDMWSYVSLGYLRQKVVEGEVGSSVMPHKVNPIDFENAEANAGLAKALFSHLSEKLPISRMQRDLSDSSALRNIGSAFGYSGLALLSARRGLARSRPDQDFLTADLVDAWEVLTEAVQTVMRRYGVGEPYERLKSLTRGKLLTQEELHHFVRELNLPEHVEQRLLRLTPETYTGLAAQLANLVELP